jgi:transcriptional regulator of acetoin/glycerol metabolism
MDTGALTKDSVAHATAEGTQPQLFLVLERGRPYAGGARHSLANIDRVVIGRGATRGARRLVEDGARTLAITVPDGRMSSSHAVLVRSGQGFSFIDRGSTNGSRIDRARVETAELHDGALLELASTFFRFRTAVRTPFTGQGDVDSSALTGLVAAFGTVLPWLTADLERLARVGTSDVSILLLGESGTGKEVLARGIHDESPRRGQPFVAVNCGALPAGLVESALFGHKKGAFSGALADEPGFVRAASGGTLFLDEIADLPKASQASLLRVLQEREVVPVGATKPVPANVRVVAATHKPLAALVESGDFRGDLYARLTAFTFALPPLRERMDDLGVLIAALLRKSDASPSLVVGADAAHALLAHPWPSNVRELEQCLTVSRLLAACDRMDQVRLAEPRRAPAQRGAAAPHAKKPVSPEDAALRAEVVAKLAEHDGNVTRVGQAMGKARSQIQRWIKRFEIDPREHGR